MNEARRVFNYFTNNLDRIYGYTMEHLILIAIAISLSVVLWVSLGVLLRNNKKMANGVMGVGSFVMSVPSVALYGILISIPGLGLSRQSAVLALVLYSMLPILRNVYVALNEVDKNILEAAKGMGMSETQILRKVQLPLALPVILAGVRVATVMMVGIGTLAVYIGERNLGVLIEQGLTRSRSDMIITGALLVTVFVVIIDFFIGWLEKTVVSKGIQSEEVSQSGGEN
ncbi:ABC transporter permease [Isachenkonia alkalipeptolytica]|uniref:ABC transporter permease n=1 Tax=Isachenkonia alkalipeptolytica TaxID=2565777 RepID=A0AA44BDK7_9CLOT|nr:ABC transporter permease [Isachenkonia alkalipeptolytica]NBG88409.1 ABC transporter permease [Isachenkonia alkalipeptolytica]